MGWGLIQFILLAQLPNWNWLFAKVQTEENMEKIKQNVQKTTQKLVSLDNDFPFYIPYNYIRKDKERILMEICFLFFCLTLCQKGNKMTNRKAKLTAFFVTCMNSVLYRILNISYGIEYD